MSFNEMLKRFIRKLIINLVDIPQLSKIVLNLRLLKSITVSSENSLYFILPQTLQVKAKNNLDILDKS